MMRTGLPLQTQLRAFAMALFLIATYTLVIKFINPLTYMVAFRMESGYWRPPPIMWDFWWVAHIWLGCWLWNRHRAAWLFGMAISVVEIGIIVTKFVRFLQEPKIDFWGISWLINKCCVLALFILLLAELLRPAVRRYLRGEDA